MISSITPMGSFSLVCLIIRFFILFLFFLGCTMYFVFFFLFSRDVSDVDFVVVAVLGFDWGLDGSELRGIHDGRK